MKKVLFILITSSLLFSVKSQATPQGGLGFELGVGYPEVNIATDSLNAKYTGIAAQGNLLFPLLSSGAFSVDLDLMYRYTTLENNSSNQTLSEWAHFTSFGTGLRANYSFLFPGVDLLILKSKHLRAGTDNQIFEYNLNPVNWHVGVALPLSPVTSVVFGYSQMLESKANVQGVNLSLNEQVFWLRLQIDFGVSFFNLLKPSESFESTRNSFFVQ